MEELIKSILEDGKIDVEEVGKLREVLYEDGKIDKEEAKALFKLNNEAEEKCPEFKDLFIEAIRDYILEDSVLDEEEEKFLLEEIGADGQVDDNEKALLEAISKEVELPESLQSLID